MFFCANIVSCQAQLLSLAPVLGPASLVQTWLIMFLSIKISSITDFGISTTLHRITNTASLCVIFKSSLFCYNMMTMTLSQ